MKSIPLKIVLTALVLLPCLAHAQTGSITGTVTDKNTGEPLIGAVVIIDTISRGDRTNIRGAFIIDNLHPGEHKLRASCLGFHSDTIKIAVKEGTVSRIDISLREEHLNGREQWDVLPIPLFRRNQRSPVLHSKDGPDTNIRGNRP